MQTLVNPSINFLDKDLVSIFEAKNVLEVIIGENTAVATYNNVKIVFEEQIGYLRSNRSTVQGFVLDAKNSDFMENMLKINYEGDVVNSGLIPNDHTYKRFVFYSYQNKEGIWIEPVLEVIAKNCTLQILG